MNSRYPITTPVGASLSIFCKINNAIYPPSDELTWEPLLDPDGPIGTTLHTKRGILGPKPDPSPDPMTGLGQRLTPQLQCFSSAS
ncbi:MAG: hypothetical protein ACJZ5P_03285 [Candidatus Thalassarchaeaceae archaeon]